MFTEPCRIIISADSLKEVVADYLNRKLCGFDVRVTDVAIFQEDGEIILWVERVGKK